MLIIVHMAPYKPVQLLWGLNYDSYHKGSFLADFGHSLMYRHSWENHKIRQKQPYAATVIAQPS